MDKRSTCPRAPRSASSVPGDRPCTLRLSPPPPPRTPPEGGQQRPTRTGVYASSVRRGRGRDRGRFRGRDRGTRTAHTHAHAHMHTRARATLPLHTHARTRHTAAAPLLPRCCPPPPRRCCAAPPLRRRCGAAATSLRCRCHVAAATVLPRGGSLHSNPPAKDLDPPEKAASSLPLRVVLAQSALVVVTRCASVFFYAREILISVFLDSSTCSSAVPTRRACA